ncbi:MAG: PfkB family carbohydrate kinase, partial [Candidatus Enterosoma sp.]|nr:PfkB family carbohydrate kinase [Candidatus Enterosoma sp.]
MNNNKIIGARGERLLRLTSAKGRQIKNADSFSVCYGGAEGNVLRSLSCLGRKTRFLSKMGKDEISQAAVLSLKRAGVDTSFVVRD